MIAVTIRHYEDGDFPSVHRLEESGGHEPYRSAVFIRQMGIVCRNTFLIAVLDTEQVGYTIGALIQDDPREAWILRMGVREDQRRNGVGTILLTELVETFRTRGVRTIRLTVSP
jgi:ribosomal protein S18 acetylase RimI-like enzyme